MKTYYVAIYNNDKAGIYNVIINNEAKWSDALDGDNYQDMEEKYVEVVLVLPLDERYTEEEVREHIVPIAEDLNAHYPKPITDFYKGKYSIELINAGKYSGYEGKTFTPDECLTPFINRIKNTIQTLNDEAAPPEPQGVVLEGKAIELLKQQEKHLNKIAQQMASKPGYTSFAELVKTLPPLKMEKEDENWILAKNAGVNIDTLRNDRHRGERYALEGIIYYRDKDGRIACKVTESKKTFYLKKYL